MSSTRISADRGRWVRPELRLIEYNYDDEDPRMVIGPGTSGRLMELDAATPATHPARDAAHFRRIIAAAAFRSSCRPANDPGGTA